MAFIVKRGKAYSVIYYIGTGKDRRQVWKSGLSYSAAKAEKRRIEREIESEASCGANGSYILSGQCCSWHWGNAE